MRLLQAGGVDGYGRLVYAAFVMAVRRRFSPTWSTADVVRFVATARADLIKDGVEIDPRSAEILIRRALGDGIRTELEQEASARAQIFMLVQLVLREELDDAGLDELITQSRWLAEQMCP